MSEELLNAFDENALGEGLTPGGAGGGAEGRLGRPGAEAPAPPPASALPRPPLSGRRGPAAGRLPTTETQFTPEQRLLVLDAWRRSGLPAGDFAPLVGISKHTLYWWQKKFEAEGPAGLADKPKGAPAGSRLPEPTRRSILMLKESHPDWGCQKISDLLLRGPALPASPSAVARVLHEAGYVTQEEPSKPHVPKVTFFERAKPNQLWQTDLFTFIL